ncbi:MAG: hypothetical protein AB1644_03850 [Candidatus Zixiibacteriota bacterium]
MTLRLTAIGVLIGVGFLSSVGMIASGCAEAGKKSETVESQDTMASRSIEEVLSDYTDKWMALPGVIGTGIGEQNGKPCLKVFVVSMTAELKRAIPAQVEEYPVLVEATGEFKALDNK